MQANDHLVLCWHDACARVTAVGQLPGRLGRSLTALCQERIAAIAQAHARDPLRAFRHVESMCQGLTETPSRLEVVHVEPRAVPPISKGIEQLQVKACFRWQRRVRRRKCGRQLRRGLGRRRRERRRLGACYQPRRSQQEAGDAAVTHVGGELRGSEVERRDGGHRDETLPELRVQLGCRGVSELVRAQQHHGQLEGRNSSIPRAPRRG